MTLEDIQLVLINVLREVQELCGRKWEGLATTGKPIGDLNGFDSLCSIEATAIVEQRLGGTPLGPSSLFISEEGTRALTLQEISNRVYALRKALQGES